MYVCIYGGFHKWGYPQIIHFHRIFPYKPYILNHFEGKPHTLHDSIFTLPTAQSFHVGISQTLSLFWSQKGSDVRSVLSEADSAAPLRMHPASPFVSA